LLSWLKLSRMNKAPTAMPSFLFVHSTHCDLRLWNFQRARLNENVKWGENWIIELSKAHHLCRSDWMPNRIFLNSTRSRW
jgi:hypothetical protein